MKKVRRLRKNNVSGSPHGNLPSENWWLYSIYDCVKRIHSKILTEEIAFEYKWHGLKGNKSFKDSLLAKATIEAIMINKHIVASEKNIEEAIKSWLRHAKDRLLRRGPADKENFVPD
ncbi:hypothetical protein JTB14_034033 [Gonioctena quinquepunctata]|nr:hypothetical protein JTB14_034033 [Gonioctena quinquepunctata]